MKYSYEELAGMIDHALLHPTLTTPEMQAGCELAAKYRVATVCIKPYAVKWAAEWLKGSGVAVGTVIGFPHGGQATEVKILETSLACRAGATEVDMVVNVGAALSGEWTVVLEDITAVVEEAHRHGARAKVIFETGYLPDDSTIIELCRLSERAGADWVKTSTGFGFVKSGAGMIATGATEAHLRVMRSAVGDAVQVKASGGVRDLGGLIAVRDLGCTRCGTSATAAILDEYLHRENAAPRVTTGGILGGGY